MTLLSSWDGEPGLETLRGEQLSCARCRCLPGRPGEERERRELGMFPDSAAVRSLAEALPLLIGCGNGGAPRSRTVGG